MPPSRARRRGPRRCPRCGKNSFKDEIGAKIALSRIQGKDDPSRPKTERRAYQCAPGHWHLTSRTIEEQFPRRSG